MKKLFLFLAFFAALAANGFAQTKPFAARVIRCYDGDTITVEYERYGRTLRRNVRLIGIDAPEVRGGQPRYEQSRDTLRGLLLGAKVIVEPRGRDTKWNRVLAKVSIGGQDASLRQISVGAAWFYGQYAKSLTLKEKAQYGSAEGIARSSGYGIWADTTQVPPWQWRRGVRQGK